MNVAIRTDASASIGTGHVKRCLALARELRATGATVSFISRALQRDLVAACVRREFVVYRMPPVESEAEDARATIQILGVVPPDLLIVDHYDLGSDWESIVKGSVRQLLVIDDLARPHDCDVLLDQNWRGPMASTRYDGMLPESCRRLFGPLFALLEPEYAELRRRIRSERQPGGRVVVSFGGADPTNETVKALSALSRPPFSRLPVDVVIGAAHPAPVGVVELAGRRGGCVIHVNPPSLAPIMEHAVLAIGAGGISMWERLCLNVPSAVATVAANQQMGVKALADAGYVTYVGCAPGTTEDDYARALEQPPPNLHALPPLVDGIGAKRVREFVVPSPTGNARIRPADWSDAALFFHWRDAVAQRMSFSRHATSWPSHRDWFNVMLHKPDVEMFVAEAACTPLGQFRLEYAAQGTTLSYSVDATFRGRGWGTWLVAEAMKRAAACGKLPIRAQVRRENQPSRRIFTALSWTEHRIEDRVEYVWTGPSDTRRSAS